MNQADHFNMLTESLPAGRRRVTNKRLLLFEALGHQKRPVAIKDLHASLPKGTMDLMTVYRICAGFETMGTVRRNFRAADGVALYELTPAEPRVWALTRKGGVEARIEGKPVDDLEKSIATIEAKLRERGFRNVSHLVQFHVAE